VRIVQYREIFVLYAQFNTVQIDADFNTALGILELSPCFCTLEVAAKKATNPLAEVLVPLALTNEAMFHSLLAFASSLLDAHSGYKTGSTTTLLHRIHAMRLINESLNDPHRATSDTVLASICFVSATDVSMRDISSKPIMRPCQ
jgi:Fungal specific transcription factor domain